METKKCFKCEVKITLDQDNLFKWAENNLFKAEKDKVLFGYEQDGKYYCLDCLEQILSLTIEENK